MSDEFRVEVELDDEQHGYSVDERLKAVDLDDEARKRLGGGVMATRDGSRLFLYGASESEARQAERTVRELIESDGLSAEIAVTRWHPAAEEWQDAALPLPSTPDEERAEVATHEAAEAEEARAEGRYEWEVLAHLSSRGKAIELAERLAREGVPVRRRWRYVSAGAVTEERAEELAERLRAELPDDADVSIDVDLSDLPRSPLQFLPF